MTAMAFENNKFIGTRFLHLVSEGNITSICELISPSWKMHIGLGTAEIPRGHDGMQKLFESFGNIEQQWTIDDIIAEGDKVVIRATNYCRQQTFFGIPSYGQPQTFTATFIHRIVDGRIEETWRNADDLGRVLQLGAEIKPKKSETAVSPTTRKINWWEYIFRTFWWKRSY